MSGIQIQEDVALFLPKKIPSWPGAAIHNAATEEHYCSQICIQSVLEVNTSKDKKITVTLREILHLTDCHPQPEMLP